MHEIDLLANPPGGLRCEDEPIGLTAAEADLLADCEVTISRGLDTFREVGDALMQVRDNRLYRAEFATFDLYAEQRWGFTKGRANQLVRAASVAQLISDTDVPEIKNEAQARELAPLLDDPVELRAAFTEAVKQSNGQPTAAVIRDVVRKRMEPESPLAKVAERELDKADAKRELIETHNAWVAESRQGFTPERIAEIEESVRPAVQFAQLVSVCRDFLEQLAKVDLSYAAQGVDYGKAAPIREAIGRLATLQRTLEVGA